MVSCPYRENLELPHLAQLGLGFASEMSTGQPLSYPIGKAQPLLGAYTYAKEISSGKDTLSGHWELCGVPVNFQWGISLINLIAFPKKL